MYRFLTFLLFISVAASAQKITYSDYKSEDDAQMTFEIIGKQKDRFLIYKNIRWKHILAFYNDNMRLERSYRMPYINETTFNIDFIPYQDFIWIIYQYQKNNVVYCKAVKIDNDGNKLTEPELIDTTSIWPRQDKTIYTTTFSDNKKHILVYKMYPFNDRFTVVTKLYNNQLQLQDSARSLIAFNERSDVVSNCVVDNEGTIFWGRGKRPSRRESIGEIMFVAKNPLKNSQEIEIPLEKRFIDEFKVKVDNMNRRFVISSFYYTDKSGNLKGTFVAAVSKSGDSTISGKAFHPFPDSLRSKLNLAANTQSAFENLNIKNIVVTKDGDFILTTESSFYQTNNLQNWRSWDNWNVPYGYNSYWMNSGFNNFYRPLGTNNWSQSTKYYYDDILIMGFDKNLNARWNSIIPKKQSEEGDDNNLSFGTVNLGAELHYLFIEKDRNQQVMNNYALLPRGDIKRYATIKSFELGYEFMPKLSKQISATTLIIPCNYRGYICFAKVDFSG